MTKRAPLSNSFWDDDAAYQSIISRLPTHICHNKQNKEKHAELPLWSLSHGRHVIAGHLLPDHVTAYRQKTISKTNMSCLCNIFQHTNYLALSLINVHFDNCLMAAISFLGVYFSAMLLHMDRNHFKNEYELFNARCLNISTDKISCP